MGDGGEDFESGPQQLKSEVLTTRLLGEFPKCVNILSSTQCQ